jgi:transposase
MPGLMRGHSSEHYQQVAEVYDEAIEANDPPTQAVAEAFGVPYSTAARWVRRTRQLGLLPAPAPGLARGNPPLADEGAL